MISVLLLLASLALLVFEVIFPAMGMAGLAAATAYVFALIFAFDQATAFGWTMVFAGVIAYPFALWGTFRVMTRSRLRALTTTIPPQPGEIDHGTAATGGVTDGTSGVAATDLRPSGRARFGAATLDVIARAQFISRGAAVFVVHVDGLRIIVDTPPSEPTETPP